MKMKISKINKVRISIIIIFVLVFVVNFVLKNESVTKVIIDDSHTELIVQKRYYDYFKYINYSSVFILTTTVLGYIRYISSENRKLNNYYEQFTKLFDVDGMELIEPEMKLGLNEVHIVNAWNKNVRRVINLQKKHDQFFNETIHDLKMPIQVMQSYLDLLSLDTGSNQYIDKISELLIDFNEEVKRILHIENIKFSEITTNQLVDISEVVVEIVNCFEHFDVKLCLLDQYPGQTIKIDVKSLRKILLNVIDNGMKYSTDGYVYIVINQGEILIQNQINPNNVLGDIFSEPRQKSQKGNGLGSQIVAAYAEMMKIHVKGYQEGDSYIVQLKF